MLPSNLLPSPSRRAFARLRLRAAAVLDGAPMLFVAVVLGVALVFRLAIGWAR